MALHEYKKMRGADHPTLGNAIAPLTYSSGSILSAHRCFIIRQNNEFTDIKGISRYP
jgi:hypothetical protein